MPIKKKYIPSEERRAAQAVKKNSVIRFVLMFCICAKVLLGQDGPSFFKCDFYIHTEDYPSALNSLCRIEPEKLAAKEKALYFNKKGFIYFKLGHYPSALTNYSAARRVDPSLDFVHNNIGIVYFTQNDHARARENYLKALAVNSNNPRVLVNLAVNEFFMRNYTQSFQWYMKALKTDKAYIRERFDKRKGMKKLRELAEKYPEDRELRHILEWAEKNYHRNITDF